MVELHCKSHRIFRPTHKPKGGPGTVLGQCDTFHWPLKAFEYIHWRVVSSSSQLTADRCCAVILKANKTGTVLDWCSYTQKWCVREGRYVSMFSRSRRLKPCSNQITQPTLPMTHTFTFTVDIIAISRMSGVAFFGFWCAAFAIWKKMSVCYFASCTLFCICVKSCDDGISDWELWKVL